MSNKTILIVFMHNPNSITSNAHNKAKAKSYARNGDPRFAALMSIAVALRQRSHNVLVEVAGGLSVRPAIAQSLLKGFTWADDAAIQRFGKPSLCIAWFAYFADKGTRRNPMVRRLLKDPTIPRLWYENGMTKGSVTVDPKGFLAESFYVESLNWRVQQHYNERACASHVKQHLEDDSSKRPQQARVDVPTSMLHRYVFVPTQKFDDLSVVRYSRISYPQLLDGAAAFCAAHNLSLVIKIHPHLRGEQLAGQQRRIRRLQARYPAVLESRASINFLTTNALFTVTLNGGTLMDNFYTGSPVLGLAKGFFSSTDAVVSDNDVERGLRRMLHTEVPWSKARRQRQRQVVCWYDRMCLKGTNTGEQNLGVIQAHVDALALPRPIVL